MPLINWVKYCGLGIKVSKMITLYFHLSELVQKLATLETCVDSSLHYLERGSASMYLVGELFLKIVMSLGQLLIGYFAQLMALIWLSTNWSSYLMNSGQSASAVLLIATAIQLIRLVGGCWSSVLLLLQC